MDAVEQAMWADTVVAVNRTDKPLEWRYDSRLYIIPPRGNKSLPRFIVMAGINQFPVSMDPQTGLTSESLIGIEGADSEFPITPMNVDVNEVMETPKVKTGSVILDGKKQKVQTIDLGPHKEIFAANNA